MKYLALLSLLVLASCAERPMIAPPPLEPAPVVFHEPRPTPQYREVGPCEGALPSSEVLNQIHVSAACLALENSDVPSAETAWCWQRDKTWEAREDKCARDNQKRIVDQQMKLIDGQMHGE